MFKLYNPSVSLDEVIMNCQMKRLLITKFQNEIALKSDEIDFINDSDDLNDEKHENKWRNWVALFKNDI